MAFPRASVDLVPPPQPDQPPACDVLQVVKVRGEEEHGDDEDEDAVEVEVGLISERVRSYDRVPRRYQDWGHGEHTSCW